MLSKNQIKFVNSLKQKKERKEQGLFIAEGTKIVLDLLNSKIKVKQVFATEKFVSENKIPSGIECYEIKPTELDRISSLTTPNESIAICEIPKHKLDETHLINHLTLVLDGIQDPGNMGTIIRTADWFGIKEIICSNESADVYNPKVVQATMGSIARVKVHYVDLEDMFSNKLKGKNITVYGALLEGENIYKKQLFKTGLIVIGNESKGISEKIKPYITEKIKIPSFALEKNSKDEAESLNASIATAIICSEFRRS